MTDTSNQKHRGPRLAHTGSSLGIAGAAALLAAPAIAQELPKPIDLGTFGGPSSEAAAINDAGAIVGEARNANPAERIRDVRATYHAFYRPPGGSLVNIDASQGVHTSPVAVNAEGAVLAAQYGSNAQRFASVYWREGEGQRRLDPPEGFSRILPADLDDRGVALVNGRSGSGTRALLLDVASGEATALPCPQGASCEGQAMNEAGAVLGYVGDEPAVWEAGTHVIRRLAIDARYRVIYVQDINDRGTVVGFGHDESDFPEVLVWSAAAPETLRAIGPGRAFAVNDHDVAVGSLPTDAEAPGGNREPRLWELGSGRSVALPGLDGGGSPHGEAVDINNAGIVVGTVGSDEGQRAVRWETSLGD